MGAIVGVACVDMSAPKGPASISALQLPSPSVVIGDVMRDSTGAPAKLSVIAYDANGAKIADVATQFFVTDTGAPATVDASGVVTGTRVGTVHVVGQIGALQTPVASILISVAPKLIARADTITRVDTVHASTDTAHRDVVPAAVMVSGDSGGAAGFIVKYTLVHAPPTKSTSKTPAVFLVDDQSNPSTVDTTDATGRASRTLVVVGAFLADTSLASLLSGKPDIAVLTAQTSYKGALVSPSPIRIVIPIVATLKLP